MAATIIAGAIFTPTSLELKIQSISFSNSDIIRIGLNKREPTLDSYGFEPEIQLGSYFYNIPRDFYIQ